MTALPNGSAPVGLTRTQKKFWEVLSDGKPHTPEELTKCLWDDCGLNLQLSVKQHMSDIRRKLPPGYQIVATFPNRRTHYQLLAEIHLTATQTPPPTEQSS